MICGDYLSLPSGFGGHSKVGLFVDVFSGFAWGYKLKVDPTAKNTIDCLTPITDRYVTPDTFMADGGTHFRNTAVDTFCEERGIKHITTPAYAPWNNGLVEGLNRLLLGRLRRLCCPDMDATIDDDETYTAESLPYSWPKHFDEAIRQLNDRIRTETNRTPRELLFGLSITPEHAAPGNTFHATSPETVQENEALADMVRMSAHTLQLDEAERTKAAWDERTPAVSFEVGDLVQWYDSSRDENHSVINKLAPRWSTAHIITEKFLNSYTISTLNGTPFRDKWASYQLRKFIPLRGSDLDLARAAPIPRTQTNNTHDEDRTRVQETEEEMGDNMMPPFEERESPNRSAI